VLAERPRAVLAERVLQLLARALGDHRALNRQDHEGRNPDLDPAGAPGPDVARHVRAGTEEAEDRDREDTAGLAGDASPRHRLDELTRPTELEEADDEDGSRADADEEREQVDVQDVVIGVHVTPFLVVASR